MASVINEEAVELKLAAGDILQIQFVGQENRKYVAKVIGYLAGQSLVVTTPRLNGKAILVREGQPLVARILSGNTCYGFNSQIIHSSMRPYPHLHLAYPDEMESMVVRKALRVETNLPVTVSHPVSEGSAKSQEGQGRIVDISTGGAMLTSETGLGASGDLITLTARVPIAGTEKFLKLPAVIRSVREPGGDESEYQYGVEFQLLEHMDIILLHGFVFEQMQKQSM